MRRKGNTFTEVGSDFKGDGLHPPEVKLLVLGDVHGHFDAIWTAYEKETPDAILQSGDLADQEHGERRFDVGEYPDELPPVPFVWVLGNHERLDTYQEVGVPLGFFGTHRLGDLTIVGVGGIPGTRRAVHWDVTGSIDRLAEVEAADILLSHETCHPFYHPRGEVRGDEALAKQCRRLKPKVHFSSHHDYSEVADIDGVAHVRLPHAWEGYAVWEQGDVRTEGFWGRRG